MKQLGRMAFSEKWLKHYHRCRRTEKINIVHMDGDEQEAERQEEMCLPNQCLPKWIRSSSSKAAAGAGAGAAAVTW